MPLLKYQYSTNVNYIILVTSKIGNISVQLASPRYDLTELNCVFQAQQTNQQQQQHFYPIYTTVYRSMMVCGEICLLKSVQFMRCYKNVGVPYVLLSGDFTSLFKKCPSFAQIYSFWLFTFLISLKRSKKPQKGEMLA